MLWLSRSLVAASARAFVGTRCSQGANLGDLYLALRSRVGTIVAKGTRPLYEQIAACSRSSPRLILKGSWARFARSPYRASGCLEPVGPDAVSEKASRRRQQIGTSLWIVVETLQTAPREMFAGGVSSLAEWLSRCPRAGGKERTTPAT